MRLATFNLESLDLPPRAGLPLETRADILRPSLERLDADVLCLQEVNAQRVPGEKSRRLVALDQLLAGTRYEAYHRACVTGAAQARNTGAGPADVHNLVTLSRWPIASQREVRHELIEAPVHRLVSGDRREDVRVSFERPLLLTEIELASGSPLVVINLHLRAPLASAIAGAKSGQFSWRTVSGWAEGYYLSALKRSGQALELRLVLDRLLAERPHALIAVAGDFNAEDHETPLRLAVGAAEDTGSSALTAQSLIVLDRAVPQDRRWSVLHAGRPQMLDHILASHELYGRFRAIEVHNEPLGDEVLGYSKAIEAAGSYHAPVVATFDL